MKNNLFFKSAITLLFGGAITKILGFILKIIITRLIGTDGIALYSLLTPTYSLFMTIAILSYPIAISKCVAEEKRRSKKILFSVIPISIFVNIITIGVIFLIAPIISNTLLKEPRLYYPLLVCTLTLPFISLSSIIKGYYWGKQKMFPYMVSNVIEQIVRITILVTVLPIVYAKGIILTISVIIGVNIISETSSIIVMLLFMPRGSSIKIKDIEIDRDSLKDVYSVAIPTTSSKIVGSIFYFLEPIVLTNTLLFMGYSRSFILREYGIINGYAIALLMIPQFLTQSISTSLVPELSKNFKLGNKKKCFKRVKQIIFLSLLIGGTSTLIISLFPRFFLRIIFGTELGINYVRVLAPFMLLYFIDMPIISSLQALNKSKTNMLITLIGGILKLLIIFVLSLFKIGLYPLIISIIFNLIFVTRLNYKALKKALS